MHELGSQPEKLLVTPNSVSADKTNRSFPSGEGEVLKLIRAKDWAKTPLGPFHHWPQNLWTATGIMLNSRFPMFIAWGAQRIFLYNDAYSAILGQKHPASLGEGFATVWPEVWQDIEPLIGKVDAGEAVYIEDLRLVLNRQGYSEEAYFTFSYSPIREDNGAVAGLFCACVETTARKTAEAELKTALESSKLAEQVLARSSRLIETLPQPFFAMDAAWTVTYWNPASVRVIGLPKSEVLGRNLWTIFPGLEDSDFGKTYKRTLLEQVQTNSEAYYKNYDKWYEISAFPFGDGVAVAFIDITDRKRVETTLGAAKDAAERANALKTSFLTNMSHEIRTPLGAMLGFADLLRDATLSAEERSNYLDILTRNGEQLSVIIDDILDLSKVEAGHLTLEIMEASPAAIVTDILVLLRVRAQEKHLTLDYVPDPTTPVRIQSDPHRMRQILLNLVSNAVKFTRSGSVSVRSYVRQSVSGGATLCFEIADTGIGIARAKHEPIFDVFVQADGSTSRRFGGTGLGLALSRRLARALGGDVSILRSEEGVGSTFLFQLPDQPVQPLQAAPLASGDAPSRPRSDKAALKGARILIVDDAADNRLLISNYLTRLGANVATATDGFDGYQKAMAGHYDIVLMDLQMPEMDGYVATQKLRSSGFKQPVIALSAHAMTETRKKCLNIGCNDHLAKPINFPLLVATISRHLQESG